MEKVREWFSYAQWCDCLGSAAGHYGSRISFGPATHAAWLAGHTPGAFARSLATRNA